MPRQRWRLDLSFPALRRFGIYTWVNDEGRRYSITSRQFWGTGIPE